MIHKQIAPKLQYFDCCKAQTDTFKSSTTQSVAQLGGGAYKGHLQIRGPCRQGVHIQTRGRFRRCAILTDNEPLQTRGPYRQGADIQTKDLYRRHAIPTDKGPLQTMSPYISWFLTWLFWVHCGGKKINPTLCLSLSNRTTHLCDILIEHV